MPLRKRAPEAPPAAKPKAASKGSVSKAPAAARVKAKQQPVSDMPPLSESLAVRSRKEFPNIPNGKWVEVLDIPDPEVVVTLPFSSWLWLLDQAITRHSQGDAMKRAQPAHEFHQRYYDMTHAAVCGLRAGMSPEAAAKVVERHLK